MAAAALLAATPAVVAQNNPRVHAVVDLGHQFTFYADGRFHTQYLPNQPYAANWGSLFNFDFSYANLLVLLGSDSHLKYLPEDIKAISAFLAEGGGVVLLGSAGDEPQNALAREFGFSFAGASQKPLKSASPMISGDIAGGGDALTLEETKLWQVLITDAQGRPVLAPNIDRLYENCLRRLAPYGCHIIRKTSVESAADIPDGSLDSVYIDGNHRFEYVVADLAAWTPKIRGGGIMSGHDWIRMSHDVDMRNNPVHVQDVLPGWTHAYRIKPWFVLGSNQREIRRDVARSWFWVKP